MVKGFSALLDMRRCKDQAHSISLKISNSLNTCFVVSFQCTESSLLVFTPNSLQGVWTASAAAPRSLILTEVEGKCQWQAPVCSWHLVNAAAIAEGTSQNTISTCSRGCSLAHLPPSFKFCLPKSQTMIKENMWISYSQIENPVAICPMQNAFQSESFDFIWVFITIEMSKILMLCQCS